MISPKVFGIGFHKTGTSSLAEALRMLGYTVAGPNGTRDPDIAAKVVPMALDLATRFDAFQDNPWPILYREMDAAFPGSKFVLTTRPVDKWIASVVGHFGERSTPMREWIYGVGVGSPLGNEAVYRARFERHYREIAEYFAARQDILVLGLTEGEGWEKLCPFLELPIPPAPFPHRNAAKERRAG